MRKMNTDKSRVASVTKTCCRLVVTLLVAVGMAHTAAAYGYKKALETFKSAKVGLWIKSSLPDKMKKLRSGVAVVVFEASWQDGKAVVECDFAERKYRMHRADDTTESLSSIEFSEMCKAPALVSYDDAVYINLPTDSVDVRDAEEVLGNIMVAGLFDIAKELFTTMPKRKVRISFVSQGNPDLLIKECTVSDCVTNNEMKRGVRDMLEIVTKRNWRREHDAKARSIPRKPPVVYGNVQTVVKHIDGTFEIPREAPPTSKTITWMETIYAEGWGELDSGERFTVHVPVGERECHRVKPLTQMYNYDELKAKLEAYEKTVDELKNDRPPVVTDEMVARVISQGRFKFSVAK